MKILYDCFSCSPYYGSDEGIGWMWPYLMREKHEVWALVRSDRKADIERYCKEHRIHDIHFIYCDIPERFNFYYRNLKKNKNGTLDFLFYQFLWQFPAYQAAKKVHAKVHFDLVHHVATNDFRFIGKLDKLNIPLIIGPVGGAQEVPVGLRGYATDNKKQELLRSIINRVFTSMPGYRRALKKAKKIYFSNNETLDYLFPGKTKPEKCQILSEIGVDENSILEERKREKKTTNFLWAGYIKSRKGLLLLLDALEKLPLDRKWTVTLCGDGPQRELIQKKCKESAFADRVVFKGRLPYEEVLKEYEKADVFIFPSIRETTGTVLVEAMSRGLPVICLKQGGGQLLVDEKSGYVIPVDSQEICTQSFADAMLSFIDYPEKIVKMGSHARKRIFSFYTWQKKCSDMELVYREICE